MASIGNLQGLSRFKLIVLGILVFDLVCYFIIRQWVVLLEYCTTLGRKRLLIKRMQHATTYSQWKSAASELDAFLGLEEWKWDPSSPFYDYQLVQKIVRRLRRFRESDQESSVKDICTILKHSG